MIQKQLGDSPKPIFELESHFEKSMKFAIFGNFRLQQRTEAISCKSGPLKSTLQGSQRREKCFFDLKNFKNLLESPQVIQKQLRDSPEPIFELESHFENP